MIILDENINEHQCVLLRSWRIRARLIGSDLAHKGIQDEQIIPLLHTLNRATFFTRDVGFYRSELCPELLTYPPQMPGFDGSVLRGVRTQTCPVFRRWWPGPDAVGRRSRLGRQVRTQTCPVSPPRA